MKNIIAGVITCAILIVLCAGIYYPFVGTVLALSFAGCIGAISVGVVFYAIREMLD